MTDHMTTELRVFHNRLRILTSIDLFELVAVGVLDRDDLSGWAAFNRNPHSWFIRCSDEQAAKLWGIIKQRESGK